MNIYGKNVVLRAIEPEDNQMLMELMNDPSTESNLIGYSFPVSLHEQKKWSDSLSSSKNILRCIVALKEQPEQGLGTIILTDIDYKNATAEIHIKLSQQSRHKGIGTDAITTMVKYAFSELRLNCIYANIVTHNQASQNLFKKCGFSNDGVLRNRVYKNNKFTDLFAYSILKEEFDANQKQIII